MEKVMIFIIPTVVYILICAICETFAIYIQINGELFTRPSGEDFQLAFLALLLPLFLLILIKATIEVPNKLVGFFVPLTFIMLIYALILFFQPFSEPIGNYLYYSYFLIAALGIPLTVLLVILIVKGVGFRGAGVAAGSCAAGCQSCIGSVAKGSCFACCQSCGASY